MKNKKLIITAVAILAVVVLGIKGKGLLEQRKEEVANEPLPATAEISVEVTKAEHGVLQNSLSFLAEVLSDKSIKISTKLAGYVEKVLVEEAQKVKKGDLLVVIDSVELKSNIEALESAREAQESDALLAQSIYERNEKLYRIGGISKEKLEISKVTFELKRAALENTKEKIAQLKHQLGYLKIVAPFDGVVESVLLHEGDLAAAGKPIIAMSDHGKKLLFSFAPDEKKSIAGGQRVFFGNREIGYVKSIYPSAKNGLVAAEVTLSEKLSYPTGTTIYIDVLTRELEGCILPAGTLLHKKEGTYVMVYDDGRFTPARVDVEIETKERVIVTPCPKGFIALGSEAKLTKLQALDRVNVLGETDEK
ncbi:secretion protein HlyD [Hydrogenimonas sp.]|nr:secretion protein HlyD [Hydrogenimonas sp.]